jgi:fluoroquinolone resistance protein
VGFTVAGMAENRQAAARDVVHTPEWDAGASAAERHTEVDFVDLDLVETELAGVEFDKCAFRNVRFNCATLTDVAFLNCTFSNCTFFDATLTRCKLVGSAFERCTFDIMTVDGGDWSFVGLARADLSSTTITGTRMREADLTGARCHGATIRDTDLSGATLRETDFTRCDLRGSDLSALTPATAELRHAIITADQAVVLAMALGLEVRES